MSYAGKVEIDGTQYPIASTLYGTCSTTASTAAKVVVLANFDELIVGTMISVKFVYSNTASNPTMNVNSTGALPIYKYGTTTPGTTAGESWSANSILTFVYDGSAWMMTDVNPVVSDTLLKVYPVGSIYMSVNSTSPATLFGGTWVRIQDTFLLAAGSTYTAGNTGGSADAVIPYHTHTTASDGDFSFAVTALGARSAAETLVGAGTNTGSSASGTTRFRISSNDYSSSVSSINDTITNSGHTHSLSYAGTSGNTTGANMPPYLAVYVWQRTA